MFTRSDWTWCVFILQPSCDGPVDFSFTWPVVICVSKSSALICPFFSFLRRRVSFRSSSSSPSSMSEPCSTTQQIRKLIPKSTSLSLVRRANKYLMTTPLCCPLLPSVLLALLFGPGFFLDLLGNLSSVLCFQLCQHLLPVFLSVLVLVADGFCVYRCLHKIREGFPLEFRHLWQAEEGKTPSQGAKVQI